MRQLYDTGCKNTVKNGVFIMGQIHIYDSYTDTHSGTSFSESECDTGWECPKCNSVNRPSNKICAGCSLSKADIQAIQEQFVYTEG